MASLPAGPSPLGVQVLGATHHLYVTDNVLQGATTEIDAGTNTVVATVAVGAYPSAVAVDPSTGHVYVANNCRNSVTVLQD